MYHAMIVDDEVSVCRGLSILIDWAQYGFSVDAFMNDGASALAQLKRDPYDLIISDIRMPGLTGLQLLGELEQMRYPGRVVILSAYADFEYAQQAIAHGAVGYLLKPVGEALLIDTVNRVYGLLDERAPVDGNVLRSAPSNLVNAAIVRINEQYGSVTVNSLAKQLFVTPNHLSRAFRQRMGVGLNEYLGNVRVEKAKLLLRNPDMMIYDVCARVGFKDIDYFCRVFKTATGHTPSAYRNEHRCKE